jgi:hypothetical protein
MSELPTSRFLSASFLSIEEEVMTMVKETDPGILVMVVTTKGMLLFTTMAEKETLTAT